MAYSPEEEESIRKGLEELCDQRGVEVVAARLGLSDKALADLLRGVRPPSAQLASQLAKARGETLEQLLDPSKRQAKPTAPSSPRQAPSTPPPAANVAACPVAPAGVSTNGSMPPPPNMYTAPVVTPPPVAVPFAAVSSPVVTVGHPPSPGVVASAPVSLGMPAPLGGAPHEVAPAFIRVPPVATSAPPIAPAAPPPAPSPPYVPSSFSPKAAADVSAATYEPTLSIFEYASLSMGLELLPHRADDVFASFGLMSPDARAAEIAHWEAFLAKSSKDRRELPAMRERMRMHWRRFDGQIAPPPPPSSAVVPPPTRNEPAPPPVSIDTYAAICAELRLTPQRADDVFAFYGLAELAARTEASRYWQERVAQSPSDKETFERIFWEKHRQLEQLAARVSAAPPMPTRYAAAVAPPKAPAKIRISFEEYVVMCVEVEMAKNREKIYTQYGLQDLTERRQVEDEWKAKLAADPALMAEWKRKTDELKVDWIDFDSM